MIPMPGHRSATIGATDGFTRLRLDPETFRRLPVSCPQIARAHGTPDFIPSPAEAYRDYRALRCLARTCPWVLPVQDFGPSGEGASPDNLVTERSLSQVTISSDLQLSLTAGILNLFGLDPSYKSRLSASATSPSCG